MRKTDAEYPAVMNILTAPTPVTHVSMPCEAYTKLTRGRIYRPSTLVAEAGFEASHSSP